MKLIERTIIYALLAVALTALWCQHQQVAALRTELHTEATVSDAARDVLVRHLVTR